MATLHAPDLLVGNLSGRLGSLVFRRCHGRIIVAMRPSRFRRPPSARQLAQRERFRAATAYAKAVLTDPVRRSAYAHRLAEPKQVRKAAFRDHLNPPEITALLRSPSPLPNDDDLIVQVKHDATVDQVAVSIRTADGCVLEAGEAKRYPGLWRYRLTAPLPQDRPVWVEATVRNLAGNVGRRTEPLPSVQPVSGAVPTTELGFRAD